VKVRGKGGDYEKNLPWYRWSAEIPVPTLSDLIGINTGKDIGLLENIKITKRGGGDVAIEMKATGEKGTVTIETENKIRAALGGSGYQIVLNDGSMTDSHKLLPSAFITIEKTKDMFVINGGGFGHGIGMSQNGANEMAKQGADYEEILALFYDDIEIRNVDKE
jgi:stage II sporulation protein D